MSTGTRATVQFPRAQVDHVRRAIGTRYRMVAVSDSATKQLEAELQDMDVPCGQTRAAHEGAIARETGVDRVTWRGASAMAVAAGDSRR